MSDTPAILVKSDVDVAHVAIVTLHNPKRRNAITFDMWRRLRDTMAALAANDAVRVVILCGSGDKAFCAGADISEFDHWRATAQRRHEYERNVQACASSLAQFPKPLLAAVRGFCIGAGFELAMHCDIRIGADSARFAVTPAKLGLGYNLDDTQLLVDRLSANTAREMLFTGRRYDAEEAHRLGIVSETTTDADLEQCVMSLAVEIAANAPLSIQASKAIIKEAQRNPEDRNRALCDTLVSMCYESQDYLEGQRAFSEKRKPQFKGR